jgi:hypothetical protein
MTCTAQGSRSSLSYGVETTYGTKASGSYTNLPFSTQSLNLSKERLQGTDIQADRMPRVDRHGNRQTAGDIVVDLREGEYDAFLESAMLGVWDNTPAGPDELKVGTTPKFFSIEDFAADISQARLFTGQTVSSMSVSIAPNQMVTTTFSMIGEDMEVASAQTSQVDPSLITRGVPFDAYSGDVAIGDWDAAPTASTIVTALDFSIDNAFEPSFVIGDDGPVCLNYGRATVEGTFTAFFTDLALINRFLGETETALTVSVNNPEGTNEYTFEFPKIKINSADTSVSGPEGRFVECSFVALYDETEGSNLVIKRPDTT